MAGIKTMRELNDFVRGATLLGTGGGGSQRMGKDLLSDSFREKKAVNWTSIDSLDDDVWMCTAFYMGSIAPLSDEDKRQMAHLGLKERSVKRVLVTAVQELEKELDIELDALIPVEMGGLNSAAPLDAAVQMGKVIIDADLAGRAIPEVAQTLPRINKLPICPIMCCDAWGDVSVIRKTHSYDMAEILGKMLSVPAYEPIGLACFAMQVKDARNSVVKGTLSKCVELGASVREAYENGRDPAMAFAEAARGRVVFRGEIEKYSWESQGGYMYANNYIRGKGNYKGSRLRIWAKNENHISWLNGKSFITSPDLLQVMEAGTGEPITNTDLKESMDVVVVGIGNPLYRTPEGIKILGPEHFGFDEIEYAPMEELVK